MLIRYAVELMDVYRVTLVQLQRLFQQQQTVSLPSLHYHLAEFQVSWALVLLLLPRHLILLLP